MENTDQPKGNNEMPKNPKPNDEVQLTIETVIPEGENELASPKVRESESESKSPEDQESKPASSTKAEEETATKSKLNDKKEDSNDERDQIETVSN